MLREDQKKIFGPLTIVGLAAALGASISAGGDPGGAFHNMLMVDGFATFFRVLVIGVGLLAVFSSIEYLKRERSSGGEYYALILFSIVGQSIMVTANEGSRHKVYAEYLGVIDYIRKPFAMERLLETVHKALGETKSGTDSKKTE